MSKGFDIEWRGVEKLGVIVKKSGNYCEVKADMIVKNNTEKLKVKAKEKAPVDTHFLVDHITTRYPGKLEGRVIGEASYNGYVEYGTRYQPPKPHIRPALKVIERQFKKDMDDLMKGLFK